MNASASTWKLGSSGRDVSPFLRSQTGIHVVFQTCQPLCTQRVIELIKTKYTHKYCLFLACLQAARVWSLMKSPESDSILSTIKIPGIHLHMSLIIALHNLATICE